MLKIKKMGSVNTMSKIIGFKLEPIDPHTSKLEIYEEEKTIITQIRHDKDWKSLSIVDISIVLDREEKLFFKESLLELLQNEDLRKYLFYSIYDAAEISTEED